MGMSDKGAAWVTAGNKCRESVAHYGSSEQVRWVPANVKHPIRR